MGCKIEISEDEMLIRNLSIKDRESIEYYSEMDEDDISENLTNAIRFGTIALKTVKVGERIDYIQKEFEKLNHGLEGTTKDLLEDIEKYIGEDGTLAKELEKFFGEDGKIVRDIFDPDRRGTPLNILKRDLANLMIDLIKEKERKRGKPTEIGGDFEGFVEDGLNEIIRSRKNCCDEIRNTSTERGLMDTTTGDFVIDIEGRKNCRLVIEVKDSQNLTGPDIKSNMKTAMENRGASYGVFINKNVEGLPDYMGWFHDYPKDKYLVCALSSEDDIVLHREILDMAFEWGRTKVMYEEAVVEGADLSKVENGMEEIRQGIDKISNLRKKFTLVEKSVTDMREISQEIEHSVRRGLEEIQREINTIIENG